MINRKIAFTLLLLILIAFALFKIQFSILGVDTGAILPTSRDVIKGSTPFLDIFTIYTPLAYYFYGLLYLIEKVPSMNLVMYFNFFFLLAGSLLFVLYNNLFINNKINYFLLVLLFLTPLIYDVKIETIAFPFLIVSAINFRYFEKTKNWRNLINLGFMVAVLFFFKQYYLIIFFQIILILSVKYNIKSLLIFILSFVVSIIFLFLFIIKFRFSDLHFLDILVQISGKYNITNCKSFERNVGIIYSLKKYFIYLISMLPIYFICFFSKFQNKRLFVLNLLIFFSNLGLFLFNINPHYIFISVPFHLYLILDDLNLKDYRYFLIKQKTIFYLLLSFFLLRNQIYSNILFLYRINDNKLKLANYYKEVAQLKNIVGNNKKVYFTQEVSKIYNYSLDVTSMNKSRIGYIFLNGDCLLEAKKKFANSEFKVVQELR